MADDDDVGIVADHPDGVGEAFALGGRAHRRIGAGDIGAAEPQHGAFERQAGARRRLVEQARQDEFGRDVGAAPDPVGDVAVREFLQKPLRDLEDRLDLLIGEVVDRNDMARQRLGFRHQSGAIGLIRAVRQARFGRARRLIAPEISPAHAVLRSGAQEGEFREANRHDHARRASTRTKFSTSRRLTKTSICFRAICRCRRPSRRTARARGGGAVRLRAAMGHGGDVRAGAPRQREPAEALHLRPEGLSPRRRRISSGLSRFDARERRRGAACFDLDAQPAQRAAPPAEVSARRAYYMAAQIESGHLCPITMTRAALAALAAAPALLAQVAPKVVTASYDPAFRPWWEKPGMTLGMGMTEKQGGTDVRANYHDRDAGRRFLYHHRAQMVSLGADVRRLPGAGAGAGRADLFLHAALSARRLGQCAAVAAAQGQARQPLQCVERSRIRRRLRAAGRRRGRRRAHHHPDGAVDAARLRARVGRLHAHGAGAGRAPLPLSHRVPEASVRPADDARGAGRSGARGRRRGRAGDAACARVRPRRRPTRARPPMRAWSRRRQNTGSARLRRASSTKRWSVSAATATSRKACCRGFIARRRSMPSGKAPATSCASTCCARSGATRKPPICSAAWRAKASPLTGTEAALFEPKNEFESEAAARITVGKLARLRPPPRSRRARRLKSPTRSRARGFCSNTRALYGADDLDARTMELLLERALPEG